MAFTGITATEAQIDQKSGVNVSSLYTDTMKTQALLQAESLLNDLTKFNWSDWFPDAAGVPNVDIKYIVTAYTASFVACEAIAYDVDAVGRGAATFMINRLLQVMANALDVLKDLSDNVAWMEDNK